jgi:hypothetical protein
MDNLINGRMDTPELRREIFVKTVPAFLEVIAKALRATSVGYPVDAEVPAACAQGRCSYYHHYLPQGPAELGHLAYHIAEQRFAEATAKCEKARGEAHWEPGLTRLMSQMDEWAKRVRV